MVVLVEFGFSLGSLPATHFRIRRLNNPATWLGRATMGEALVHSDDDFLGHIGIFQTYKPTLERLRLSKNELHVLATLQSHSTGEVVEEVAQAYVAMLEGTTIHLHFIRLRSSYPRAIIPSAQTAVPAMIPRTYFPTITILDRKANASASTHPHSRESFSLRRSCSKAGTRMT